MSKIDTIFTIERLISIIDSKTNEWNKNEARKIP